jgi:hypothetical protein
LQLRNADARLRVGRHHHLRDRRSTPRHLNAQQLREMVLSLIGTTASRPQ